MQRKKFLESIKRIIADHVCGFQSHVLPFFALVTAMLFSGFAWAWPPTYGPEFEFTNSHIISQFTTSKNSTVTGSAEDVAHIALARHIQKNVCPGLGCTVEEVRGKWDSKDFKVLFPDGWFFTISFDPMVVEVTFAPLTLKELKIKKVLIDEAIFQSARDNGLTVNQQKTAGHFNIGIRSAMNDKPENFLRFFVDYANHPELAMGILGHDIYNAPPLSILEESQRKALQATIDYHRHPKSYVDLRILVADMMDHIYTASYEKDWSATHYQAIGLKHILRAGDLTRRDAPFELRAIRGQQSAEEFILLAELMEARIQFLNAQEGAPIIYNHSSRTVFTEREQRNRFFVYVAETGLPVEKFDILIPEDLRKIGVDALFTGTNPQQALQSIESYWDLLLTSEFFRSRVVDTLMAPENLNEPLRASILARIQAEASVQFKGAPKKSWKSFLGMERKPKFEMTFEEFKTRAEIWHGLHQRMSAPMCRRLLLQAL